MSKPRVTTNPTANRDTGGNERIIEFSSGRPAPDGMPSGGLIQFVDESDGTLTVRIFRTDPAVHQSSPQMRALAKSMELARQCATGAENPGDTTTRAHMLDWLVGRWDAITGSAKVRLDLASGLIVTVNSLDQPVPSPSDIPVGGRLRRFTADAERDQAEADAALTEAGWERCGAWSITDEGMFAEAPIRWKIS